MTSIARTPDLDVLLALCCKCGTTRTVSRRASGVGGNRPLRCETCRKTTPHAAIGAEGVDWREDLNHAKPPTLTVADKLDVLRALGVEVREVDALENRKGESAIAYLWWWFDNEDDDALDGDVFLLWLNQQSSDAERAEMLTVALDRVTEPRRHLWSIPIQSDGNPVASVAIGVVGAR